MTGEFLCLCRLEKKEEDRDETGKERERKIGIVSKHGA